MPILLQKSKIEGLQKSRQSRCLDVSIAARCDGAVTKVPGNDVVPHVARRGKHHRLLKFSFITQKTFATKSATSRHRHLIDHLVSAQQERSERLVDDVKCIRATTEQ
jgi:hypothetical protein